MNCHETQELIDAYGDGELDAAQTTEIKKHLQDCSVCLPIHEEQRALAGRLRTVRFEAPPKLREKVLDSLRAEASGGRVISFYPRERAAIWAIAAVALIGAFLAGLFVARQGASAPDLLTQEIVASHVRSMMGNHLADIVSTDQHTVKPWFDGKLDFAPPVADFAPEGFPLVGGRLDYLTDRSVAALVYRHDKHVINLLVWPSRNRRTGLAPALKVTTDNGYHLLQWSDAEMSYAAVSDLAVGDLRRFAKLAGAPTRN